MYSEYMKYEKERHMQRQIESTIEKWIQEHNARPLLIRGARRVGKTYAAESVGRRIAGNEFIKLDFQTDLDIIAPLFNGPTDDVDGIMQRVADYKRVPIHKESAIVLFDEVQLCERALNSLRFFSGSGWRILATGSQLGVATRHRKLPFPSGVEQLTLHPMTFEEFLWALDERQMADAIRSHAQSLESYAAHREALRYFRLYQVIGGMPAAVAAYVDTRSLDEVRVQQREIDETYTADMSDPESGISGIAARRIWGSISTQLLRSSTKKFKYAEVERGGRRAKLIEPLEWLEGAGVISIHGLTTCTHPPLVPYDEGEGSFFKVYLADTGIMFYKLSVDPRLWLDAEERRSIMASSDFRGALAENSVMQALASHDARTYYWVPPTSWHTHGELDFLLQTNRAEVIPIEVKSSRNIRARTLARFMDKAHAPYAYVLSENDFGSDTSSDGRQVRRLPLYAAQHIATGGMREPL